MMSLKLRLQYEFLSLRLLSSTMPLHYGIIVQYTTICEALTYNKYYIQIQ